MDSVQLTAAQDALWQASSTPTSWRAGFLAGLEAMVPPDVGTFRVLAPDGVTVRLAVRRTTTWVVV